MRMCYLWSTQKFNDVAFNILCGGNGKSKAREGVCREGEREHGGERYKEKDRPVTALSPPCHRYVTTPNWIGRV